MSAFGLSVRASTVGPTGAQTDREYYFSVSVTPLIGLSGMWLQTWNRTRDAPVGTSIQLESALST